jgi:hypothetical protein
MSAAATASGAATGAKIHLGFDMGIRNLAYCLMQHEADKWTVLAWDNIDLLEGGTSAQTAKKCCACSGVAKWIGPDEKKWCAACATQKRVKKTASEKPALPTIGCGLTVGALRGAATAAGVADAKKMKKDALLAWAAGRFLMPWKPAKAMDASLSDIRKAMDTWLDGVLPLFARATLIRLENQPVMKGPTMKSVQMILFTLLGHRLEKEHGWSGKIEFVHAGVKTRGAHGAKTEEEGDESKAYRARKNAAEDAVNAELVKAGSAANAWKTFFEGRSKKSDLADAFLMALRA